MLCNHTCEADHMTFPEERGTFHVIISEIQMSLRH